jgi:hypothetical protein
MKNKLPRFRDTPTFSLLLLILPAVYPAQEAGRHPSHSRAPSKLVRLLVSSFRGRAVQRRPMTQMSLGRFRFRVLVTAVTKSQGAVPPTIQAAGRLRKGRSGLGFRVGNREACVLLSVCEAQTRYS